MSFSKPNSKFGSFTVRQPKSLLSSCYYVQWKLLNVIALALRETDNINRMITITKKFRHMSTVLVYGSFNL
jgi:hypothetical protein